ncbi:MAG: hypothetical protein EKK55_02355 [Rhodocyclaceae bacterium]|nr:MAG: hypothetical protein EKK55_02355 [Rhodocyclaceae bacterium]
MALEDQLARVVRATRDADVLEEGGYVLRVLRGEITSPKTGETCRLLGERFSRVFAFARSRDGNFGFAVALCAKAAHLRIEASAALVHPTGVLEGRAQELAAKRDEAEEQAERWCREALGKHTVSLDPEAGRTEVSR